jgi:hypothetical protein
MCKQTKERRGRVTFKKIMPKLPLGLIKDINLEIKNYKEVQRK